MSPRQLLYSPVALRHLDELWNYIAKANAPAAADRYLETVFDYCDGLVDFPYRGTARDDLRPGLRTISFRRRAVIAFAVTDRAVEILGVFHGGRDFESLVAEDPDEG